MATVVGVESQRKGILRALGSWEQSTAPFPEVTGWVLFGQSFLTIEQSCSLLDGFWNLL